MGPPLTNTAPRTQPIGADVPCIRCGYNLHGLKERDHCPECGLGAVRSLVLGEQLRDSRPAWIASLSWGVWLLLVPQIALIATVLGFLYVPNPSIPFIAAIMTCAMAAHGLGAWLLTRPENPYASQQPLRVPRFALRFCAAGPLLSVALVWAVAFAPKTGLSVSWTVWFAGVLALLYPPCPLLAFLLLRHLARRVLNGKLAEHATIVCYGYSISLCLMAGLTVARMVPAFRHASISFRFTVTLLVLTAVLLFCIWSVTLLVIFAMALTKAAREARQAWRQADAAAT